MFEMITSGLPTIATAAGGMTEIGNADCTIFVHLDNIVDDITNAIKILYENSTKLKAMREAARLRSLSFKKERFYNDFCETIKVLMS